MLNEKKIVWDGDIWKGEWFSEPQQYTSFSHVIEGGLHHSPTF